MKKENEHTEEHKAKNQQKVKVGSQEKLLLFDDDSMEIDEESFISESELEAIVENVLEELDLEEINSKPLYEGWLDEADYPEGFDVEVFKSLPSFKKRVEYAKQHLGRIGGGSARVVFGVDPSTVIKIAMNKKGLAQNEVEADVSRMGYENIAIVEEYDSDKYLYIEMERAKKLKKSDWERLTGWKFEDWMHTLHNKILDIKGRRGFRLPVPENFEEIEESELFNDVLIMAMDFSMPSGDISRASSWGIVNRNGKETPVMVDYGLTNDVLEKYYL